VADSLLAASVYIALSGTHYYSPHASLPPHLAPRTPPPGPSPPSICATSGIERTRVASAASWSSHRTAWHCCCRSRPLRPPSLASGASRHPSTSCEASSRVGRLNCRRGSNGKTCTSTTSFLRLVQRNGPARGQRLVVDLWRPAVYSERLGALGKAFPVALSRQGFPGSPDCFAHVIFIVVILRRCIRKQGGFESNPAFISQASWAPFAHYPPPSSPSGIQRKILARTR
jgi:hypothetical protein